MIVAIVGRKQESSHRLAHATKLSLLGKLDQISCQCIQAENIFLELNIKRGKLLEESI